MTIRIATYALLFLLTIGLAGCSLFVQEPRIVLKETNLVGLNSSGVDLEFLIGVANPNSFDLALLGYTYDLRVMALPAATGGAQERVTFSSEKETDVRLPIHLKYSYLLEIIKRQPKLEKLPYDLKSTLHIKSPLGTMVIPVEKNGILTVPEEYQPGVIMDRLRGLLRDIR